MSNYHTIVAVFGEKMREKLELNAHKGGPENWRRDTLLALQSRLLTEVAELVDAIDRGLAPVEVDREAADIANFALMIADNYRWNKQA